MSPTPNVPTPSNSAAETSSFYSAASMSINRSPEQTIEQTPEQTFENTVEQMLSLFPTYVRPISTATVPILPVTTNSTANVKRPDTDVEKLLTQYGKLSDLVQEQTRMYHQQANELQQQIDKQAKQHQRELRQLEQAWSHRLDTVIANTQQIANSQLTENRTTAPHNLPPFSQPATEDERNNTRVSQSKAHSAESTSREAKRPSPLKDVSTTYRIPKRSQTRRTGKYLSAVPKLVGLVVLGTGLAALSAIALSPTVLWPSLWTIIQAFIPFIFVTGLISVGITAVWDAAG